MARVRVQDHVKSEGSEPYQEGEGRTMARVSVDNQVQSEGAGPYQE